MKKILINMLIGSLLLLIGCEKFSLDIEPVSSVTDLSYWKTENHFNSFMIGIHSRLRTHQWTFFRLGTLRADEFGDTPFGGESGSGNEIYYLNTLNEENPGITGFGDLYTNINQINLFIDKALSSDILDITDKGYLLGQAYGLRAFYYFHLLRTWGNVVYINEAKTSFILDELKKPASSPIEIMTFIKEDIENSESSFANDFSFKLGSKAFWSKAATLMLKSEVYLWSAKQMGGGNTDATIAKTALTEIQTNIPSLELMPDFEDVFSNSQKNNKEIIFAVGNKMDEYYIFNKNLEFMLPNITYIGNYYDSLLNRQFDKSIDLVGTWGMQIAMKNATYNCFSNQDLRKFKSIQGVYILNNDNEYDLAGCYLKKYKGVIENGIRYWIDDFPIYRYADLLLMLAEAKSVLGEDPTNEINLVRQRAFGINYQPEIYGYPNQPIDNDINEALLKERFLEFVGEGKRWYDLRRFGVQYVYKYTTVTNENQLLWPIDKATLTNNRALVQNPGYRQ